MPLIKSMLTATKVMYTLPPCASRQPNSDNDTIDGEMDKLVDHKTWTSLAHTLTS